MNLRRLHRSWQLLRCFGPSWLMFRTYHAARMKSGLIRWQLPASTWDRQPLASFLNDPSVAEFERYEELRRRSSPKFFFDPKDIDVYRPLLSQWDTPESTPAILADDFAQGFLPFFSHERVNVGFPPRWNIDPFSDEAFPTDRHWSQISDFGAGDIKLVWEVNRFGFVFPLVRAYWRTRDEKYAELFWQLIESWHLGNPPQAGANWKCGQEISLRVMAWCFGLYGFGSSCSSTPVRIAMLANMVAVSGRRIASNIRYALSQKNNHGLSEAMGLWTIGSLFPEFRGSREWAKLGRQLLESQGRELIYADGSFSQHSMNYHRVMLHDYLWSIRLGTVLGCPFSDELHERIARASEFVYQLQDESTGRVPCYGQDDGALILPLNNCGYQDFRGIVQSTQFLTSDMRRLDTGPWDEDLLWLFGKQSLAKPQSNGFERPSNTGTRLRLHPLSNSSATREPSTGRTDFDAPLGGYCTLRSDHGFALTRAAGFRHRPAQADMLHVDIWWHGENIAIDPGTFSYNSPPPWNNPFAHTSHHNTVTVDGSDQMDRAGRFLWLPWLKGQSFQRTALQNADVSCWNGEHDGYRRLPDPVTHRRGLVRLGSDHWLVIDSISGCVPHAFRLHWLLLDAPYNVDHKNNIVEIKTSVGRYRMAVSASTAGLPIEVIRGATDSAQGWRSSFYHERKPAISINLETWSSHVVFATLLGPDASTPSITNDRVCVQGSDWNATVSLDLSVDKGLPLVESIGVGGTLLHPTSVSNSVIPLPHLEPQQCTFC